MEIGFFFVKQKAAYEMRISDWSSDVCSSELMALSELYAIAPLGTVGAFLVGVENGAMWGLIPAVAVDLGLPVSRIARSEERRVGKECVSTCRSRGSPQP